VTRQKPEIVGPDGGNDTFLGYTLASAGLTGGQLNTTISSCQNNASYPNFFGTSAATPHVAAIAALLLQANSTLTPSEIYTALENGAVAIGNAPPNYQSGYGFVQADTSATMIPAVVPAAPALSLSSSSITVGASITITWSSANTTGCTASGSWSGALASSGSQTLTPSAAGTDTYTLLCSNAAGSSPSTSVTLTVNAVASSHHGGGALGIPTLLGLAALRLASRRKRAGSRA
jgi:subtilisin family serine protease